MTILQKKINEVCFRYSASNKITPSTIIWIDRLKKEKYFKVVSNITSPFKP